MLTLRTKTLFCAACLILSSGGCDPALEEDSDTSEHDGIEARLPIGELQTPPPEPDSALRKVLDFPPGTSTATVRWSHPYGLYVVGTAFEGNTFWAQGPAQDGWRWGYLGGDVHYCVWIREENLPPGGVAETDKCGPPRSDPPGTPPAGAAIVWSNASGNDGVKATLNPSLCGGSTRRFANASPWKSSTELTNPMGDYITQPNPDVFKRYMTGDGRAIMIHDGTLGSTGGYPSNWYFVPASCIQPNDYDDIAFQAEANGRYVAAESGGGSYLIANRTAIGPWERLQITGQFVHGGVVNLRAPSGHYVAAEDGGGGEVNVNRPVASAWESWTVVKLSGSPGTQIREGDRFALRAYNQVHFLCAEGAGASKLNATRVAIGPWETFVAHFP